MRELAIGDIHGCIQSFETLLGIVNPRSDDTLVLLGDYMDRGPESYSVLEKVLELNSHCTLIPLTGNHEKLLLAARDSPEAWMEWQRKGGQSTLQSYDRRGFCGIDAFPARHWDFLENETLDFWESEDCIFVHGTVDPEIDLHQQPDFLLFWEAFANPTRHKSGKRLVCGHASQKSGVPAIFDHGICIDTFAHGGGWLTCADLTNGVIHQANEKREKRSLSFGEAVG